MHTEDDLRLLDAYRHSFEHAYHAVVDNLRAGGMSPTGRLAKSTPSIVEKLRRESIRLSQMQDIAGCRVVVDNIVEQDRVVEPLQADFPSASVIDRRNSPSHGYRAVHVIVKMFGKAIEIQVRTSLQHLWAELSEKASDVLDPAIKYGGGPDGWRGVLNRYSELVADYEVCEKDYSRLKAYNQETEAGFMRIKNAFAVLQDHQLATSEAQRLRLEIDEATRLREYMEQHDQEVRKNLNRLSSGLNTLLTNAISRLDEMKRQKQ